MKDIKFHIAVRAVFIFAVMVSFSHTIELYRSVGFDGKFDWLNNFFGVDWLSHALFATLASEVGFIVGFWSLHEAYMQKNIFPSFSKYWQEWTLFGSGLLIVGWSNIGATVGYNFLIGQPVKGIVLGISIPLFVFGAQLVNFKRKKQKESTNVVAQTANKESENENSQNVNSQFTISQIAKTISENTKSQITNVISEVANPQIVNEKLETSYSQITNSQFTNMISENTNLENTDEKFETANLQITNVESEGVNTQIADVISETSNSQITNAKSQIADSQTTNEDSQIANEKSESTNSQITNVKSENEKSQIANENPQNANEKSQIVDAKSENVDSQNLFEKYATQIANAENEEVRHAMKRAIEYHIENNKFPTIDGLAEYADVSQWHARLALNKLRGKAKKRKAV